VVIGLYASITQPVHGPTVLALLEIPDDGRTRRDELPADIGAERLARLGGGGKVVRDGSGENELSATSDDDECDVKADAEKGGDEGRALNRF
jgi:hypothetical protein